jgi:hypothetical protein
VPEIAIWSSAVQEPPVTNLIDGVLDDLERGAGGSHAEPLLGGRARVGQTGGQAITIDRGLPGLPVEVRDRVDIAVQHSDDLVPSARLAVQGGLVVDELVHAGDLVGVERPDVAQVELAQVGVGHDPLLRPPERRSCSVFRDGPLTVSSR